MESVQHHDSRRSHPSVPLRVARCALLAGAALFALIACSREPVTAQPFSVPDPADPTRQIEYFLERPAGTGPWPTIVYLHGHQEGTRPGGRDFVGWGVLTQQAQRGRLAVAVSQPGYGGSTGPADFSGERSQAAVRAVLDALRRDRLADPARIVLQGTSRGAVTAGLVAAGDPSIAGLVLIAGVYDFPAYVASASGARADVVAALREEAGASAAALESRSLLRVAHRIHATTLVVHGALDDRTMPAQAGELVKAMQQAGRDATAVLYPDQGHRIAVQVRERDIAPFVDRVLGGPKD